MLILSPGHSTHDTSAVVSSDYRILSAVQTECLTRIKCYGRYVRTPTINASLEAAGIQLQDIEVFLTSGGATPACYFNQPVILTGHC